MRNTIGQRFQRRVDVPVWLERRQLSYADKVLSVAPNNLIAYWKMDEAAGGIAVDSSPEGNDGAYTGVTLGQAGIGDGLTSPFFDGANDFNNVLSAGFIADFDGAEGGLLIWGFPDPAAFGDATLRRLFMLLIDGANFIIVAKTGVTALMQVDFRAGGVGLAETVGPTVQPTAFAPVLMTWSSADDEVHYFYDGVLDNIDNGLGVWSGANLTIATIGAGSVVPATPYFGNLAHGAIWAGAGVPAMLQEAAADLAIA